VASTSFLKGPGMEFTVFCRKLFGMVITGETGPLILSCEVCLLHLFLCPAPLEKVTGCEIWTSCRPFVRSLFQPTSRKLLIQSGMYAACKVWRCAIVHENKCIVFPARYDWPQHLKKAFGIQGVTQKIWANDSTPHGSLLDFASSLSLQDHMPLSNGSYVD